MTTLNPAVARKKTARDLRRGPRVNLQAVVGKLNGRAIPATSLKQIAISERDEAIYALRYGPKPKTLAAIGRKYKLTRQRVKQITDKVVRRTHQKTIPWERSVVGDEATIQEFLNTPLTDFPLDTRTAKCLRASGFVTLGELAALKPEALMLFRNFGKTSLKKLEELLSNITLNGMPMRLGMSRRILASPEFGQEPCARSGASPSKSDFANPNNQPMQTYEDIENQVIKWAEARGILQNSTPTSQLLKAVAEMGELVDAHAKKNTPGIIDGLGDVMVCLINYSALQGLDLVDCLTAAYFEIKDRRGYLTPEGTFVKEEAGK